MTDGVNGTIRQASASVRSIAVGVCHKMKRSIIMKKFRKICVFTSALMMALSMNIPAVSAVEFQPVSLVSQKTEIDYRQQANILMEALNYIDRIEGSTETYLDQDTVFTYDNGYQYAKVTELNFSSTADMRKYMESVLTDNFIESNYPDILGTSLPKYIDYNGELYGLNGARGGSGFGWTGINKITDITSTSFTIVAEYGNLRDSNYMIINAVLDDGLWKIDSTAKCDYIAGNLKEALSYVDNLDAGTALSLDMDTAFTDDNNCEYAKVTGTDFSSTSDIRKYMESVLTKEFINEKYSDILDTSSPNYIDYKGELYGRVAGRGAGFGWTGEEKIINITSTSFIILAEYSNHPDTFDYMVINVVLDNGLWKIGSIVDCEQTMYRAYDLIEALDYVDKIDGGSMTLNMDTAFTDDNGYEFAKVIETNFSNTSDLREYMESVLTDNFINNKYPAILGTSNPKYIDYNGELYGNTGGRGCGFSWTDKELEINNITDNSFTIVAEYNDYDSLEYMIIDVVLDDGVWKIDNISDGVSVSEISGDANCDGNVDIADVVAISAYVGDPEENALSEQGMINSDIQNTGDGITAGDILAIQQYLASVITELPL